MFSRPELEQILDVSKRVTKKYPSSYENLMGLERMAVLHLLDEPIQSALHQVLQGHVQHTTPCVYKDCDGTLKKNGRCCNDCEQLGVNVIDDIINCKNCDQYGFPCPNCHKNIFHYQLPCPN